MPASLETVREKLESLIKKFEGDKAYHLSKEYSEAQARIDFITPLFKALGWDVENEAGLAHDQREVIVERGETEGRPDYNFRLGGQTKFFVEAKAPSEPLDAARHILQAKGYACNIRPGSCWGGGFSLAWWSLALSSSGVAYARVQSGFVPKQTPAQTTATRYSEL